MKKILALVLAAMLLIAASAMAEVNPADITIGIMQYVPHVALDSAAEGFQAALSENGYADATIDLQNAQGDASNLSTIADHFIAENVDLVLCIATPAAQTMAGKTTEIPILGTAVTDYVEARLVNSNEEPGVNVSGTSDMNPVSDQIALLKEFAPDAQTVGVLYASNEDNSILQASMAKEAIEELGMSYVEVTVTNSNEVQQATQQIVSECDAIYIPTDNVFASAMSIVYGVTVESKTPVICGESGEVENGGLATLGINYYNLGYQTGLMTIRVLEGEDITKMPIEFATTYDYCVNATVAEEIGIEIPEKYQDYTVTMEAAQ